MSDFSVEQKLELVQQVRSRYYRNQSDLMNREQILYGKSQPKGLENDYQLPFSSPNEEQMLTDSTLKLRYALALVLTLLIILFDYSKTTIAGISMEQIFHLIETDYEEAIDAWVTTLETSFVEPTK